MDQRLAGGRELRELPQGQQIRASQPGPVPPPESGSRAAGGSLNPGIGHLCGDGTGLRPGWDVSPLVGPAQQGPWLGRAELWQSWRPHPTGQSLGQGLMAPGWAEMGSWAMARVGGGPGGGGQGQSGLIVPSGP